MASFTVPCAAAMYMSMDSIISASRTTTCDVMCTTNTPTVFKVPGELPSFQREKADATMPYKNTMLPKASKGNTAFTLYKNIELKNGRSAEMRKEREQFFGKMERDRREKAARELRAVVKLQAFARGVLARPWPEETRTSKKPPIIRIGVPNTAVVRQIQDELCSYSVLLGLKPISGLSLENRNKQNKRRMRIELAASLRLQSYFRMIKCVMQTKRKLIQARQTLKHRASLVITKFFKWVRRVAQHHKMQNAHRNISVVKIQTRYRMFVAYHRVKKMTFTRNYRRRVHDAQIVIRRNLFDRVRRKESDGRKVKVKVKERQAAVVRGPETIPASDVETAKENNEEEEEQQHQQQLHHQQQHHQQQQQPQLQQEHQQEQEQREDQKQQDEEQHEKEELKEEEEEEEYDDEFCD